MSATSTTEEPLKDCCADPRVTDLTHGRGEHRNYYCHRCESHQWKGKKYTKKEWERWINEVDT